MRYLYYLILLILFPLNNYGQNPSDTIRFSKILNSLENKSEVKNSDIDKMLKITDQSRAEYPDFALFHLKKIRHFIEKNKYYPAFNAYSNQILFIYKGKSQIQTAEKIITEAYNKYQEDFDKHTNACMRFKLATTASNLMNYEKSQQILTEILPDADSTQLKAGIYYQRGQNFANLGNYKNALTDCLKSINLYKSIEDYGNLPVVLDLVNIIYQQLGDHENALVYSKEALRIAIKNKNIDNIMSAYSNLGVIYKDINQIDSAEFAYNKAIEMAKKYDRQHIVAQNLLNLGNILTDSKRFKEAEEHFLKSLEICNNLNISEGVIMNYINLGNNEFIAENYSKSEFFYKKALEELKKTGEIPDFQIPIYGGLTDLYEIKGDYKNAFETYKKLQELNGKINVEQSKKEIAEIKGKYDNALKDVEIERINKDFQIKKSENKTLLFLIVFGIILTTSAILFLIYRNNQLKLLYKKNVELLKFSKFHATDNDDLNVEPNDPLKKVFDEIIHLLEIEKVYQNPNLTINDITQGINSNQKYVSAAIANYANMNFSNFINYYRINEAKKLILSQERQTLSEIMYASGFNSRTPFYNSFKKITGMSPKNFKDISQKASTDSMVEIFEEAESY